jgi:transposase-like protein
MTDQVDAGWSVREFHGLDLGDQRLNQRLLILAEAFGAQPQAPINQASADWQATKADYAFFNNPRAQSPDILLPHQQRTLEGMAAYPLVLAIQDTSFLNYTDHPATSGLGPIGGGQQGLVMHSTLAFTRRAKRRPIAEKESYKWLSALRESMTMTPSEIRLLTIADREADIFEFLTEAADLDAEYVIRAAQDRCVAGEVGQLWAHMATQAVVGEIRVEVAARPGKPARTAELRVRVAQVTLQPPLRPADDEGIWLSPLRVWAIWLHEEMPPAKVEPIDWLLLTNVAIATWQDTTNRWRLLAVISAICYAAASVSQLLAYQTIVGFTHAFYHYRR